MRFAGKELDPETGLENFGARYYRQTWGRFTQVDPLHVGAALADPQQWNRYAYARNNPLRFVDPTGMYSVCRSTPVGNSGSETNCTEVTDSLGSQPGNGYVPAGGLTPSHGQGECFGYDDGGLYKADYVCLSGGEDNSNPYVPDSTSGADKGGVPAPTNPDGSPKSPAGDVPDLPDGKAPNGQLTPNEWVPGKGTDDRGVRWNPRYPVPGQSPPNVSWDPSGHWDHNDGLGNKTRWLPNGGGQVDHWNNPMMELVNRVVPKSIIEAGLAATLTYIVISEGTRVLFPPRNMVPVP